MNLKNALLEEEMSSADDLYGSISKPVSCGDDMRNARRVSEDFTPRCGTRVVTTIQEVEKLRSVWTSFDGHRDGDIDFYLHHVQSSPTTLRPHVIVLYRDGLARALLAGRLDNTKVEQRLGYLRIPGIHSRALMFMGFRGEQTEESCGLIIKSLLDTLENAGADYAQIPTVHGSQLCRAALELPSFLYRDHIPEFSPNYILRISGDFTQVYSGLSRNLREQMLRKRKKMNAAFDSRVEFICYTQPSELLAILPEIEAIARSSYQRGLGVGFIDSDSMRRRLHFCAVKGWLRIFVAYLGGKPAGFTIGTVCNKTYTSDFLGYDPQYQGYSVGTVLQGVLIERCCEEGVQVIDFSAGYADYKKRFGNDSITVARIYVFAPRYKGIYLNGIKTITARVNKAGKYILANTGLLTKIKRAWRSSYGTQSSPAPKAEA